MYLLPGTLATAVPAVVLAGGFAFAAARDIATREVTDRLWQLLGAFGLLFGTLALAGYGALPLLLWFGVALFGLQHLVPWDDALGKSRARWVLPAEVLMYAGTIAVVAGSAWRWGIGPSAVPVAVVATLLTVLVARTLFELGVLYGGADAKALIVVGIVLPLFPSPLLAVPDRVSPTLAVLPFALTVLTNAALLSVLVPVAIAVRNLLRGEFTLAKGFTGYTMDVAEIPYRFVWVRDPAVGADTFSDDAETSAEDARRRRELAARLRAQGVLRVWVHPQLPFLVLMAAGAYVGFLAGNLLLDLFAVL